MDGCLGTFHPEILAIMGARTLSLCKFFAYGAPKFFREKKPIYSKRCLADMVNTFWTRFCPEGLKVIFASYILKDRARDWWEEVDFTLGGEAIERCGR